MKKQDSLYRKLEEFEYESSHRGGRFFKLQKSLKELEPLLKGTEGKKKKK